MSCDKGNKIGNKNLAKYISWYDVEEQKVRTLLLDVDCSDDDTKDVVDAVCHSLKNILMMRMWLLFMGNVQIEVVVEPFPR